MTDQNHIDTPTDAEPTITTAEAQIPKDDAAAVTPERRPRSAHTDCSTDRKRGTGGLDSLGNGNLP